MSRKPRNNALASQLVHRMASRHYPMIRRKSAESDHAAYCLAMSPRRQPSGGGAPDEGPRERRGRRGMLVYLPRELILATKRAALDLDRTASEITEEALTAWLRRRKRWPLTGAKED
jgi:hypothetical protein